MAGDKHIFPRCGHNEFLPREAATGSISHPFLVSDALDGSHQFVTFKNKFLVLWEHFGGSCEWNCVSRKQANEKQPINKKDTHMKLNSKKSTIRGIAMTEYLIILAIVAIASIGVTSLYGKAVKDVIVKCTKMFDPKESDDQNKVITPTMENFDDPNPSTTGS